MNNKGAAAAAATQHEKNSMYEFKAKYLDGNSNAWLTILFLLPQFYYYFFFVVFFFVIVAVTTHFHEVC